MVRTKIIATLGPASSSAPVLRKMFAAGLDVARFNFSHGTRAEALARVKLLRDLNKKHHRSVKLLADLKGNRIRVGALKTPLQLKKKQLVLLARGGGGKSDGTVIPFDYKGGMSRVKKGFMVYIRRRQYRPGGPGGSEGFAQMRRSHARPPESA